MKKSPKYRKNTDRHEIQKNTENTKKKATGHPVHTLRELCRMLGLEIIFIFNMLIIQVQYIKGNVFTCNYFVYRKKFEVCSLSELSIGEAFFAIEFLLHNRT